MELPLPRACLLISPWVELQSQVPAHATRHETRRDILCPRNLRPFVEYFLGDSGASETDPLVSPLHADLHGLPPMFVAWGGVELLREQIELFVDKAKASN